MRASYTGIVYLENYKEGKEIKWVKKEKWIKGLAVKGRNEPCTIGKVT